MPLSCTVCPASKSTPNFSLYGLRHLVNWLLSYLLSARGYQYIFRSGFMKKLYFWFIMLMVHKQIIAEFGFDLATSGSPLEVAFSLWKLAWFWWLEEEE